MHCVAGIAGAQVAFEDLLDYLEVFLFLGAVFQESSVYDLDTVIAEQSVDLLNLVGGEVNL